MTGRGGRITQGLSRDRDTPSPPQPEGGVRGTLCTTPVRTPGASQRAGVGWGGENGLSQAVARLPGPGGWINRAAHQLRPAPLHWSPRRPSSPAKTASWLPRCFCSVRGQCLLVLDPLSTPDVTPQINSQRVPGGQCVQAAPQAPCPPFGAA